MKKYIKSFESVESESESDIYIFMTKNIKGKNCKYYNKNDNYIIVYNKIEDWYIVFDNALGSTINTFSKGLDITLHTDISHYRTDFISSFIDYSLRDGGYNYKKDIIDQAQFFRLFFKMLGMN